MSEQKIKARVRLIIIKNNKILLSYTKDEDFYFYIGGKIEFGETIKDPDFLLCPLFPLV